MSANPLLEVRSLSVHYRTGTGLWGRQASTTRAVDEVSFDIGPGETLGLVGESGCGKSSTGRALLRLVKPTSGEVRFEGEDLARLNAPDLRRKRRHMQMIFQSPFASLNPWLTVGQAVSEPLEIHGIGSGSDRRARVEELLELVGLDPGAASRRPHEFSGGQRQRIGIARALATGPRFVVADEPVSALDVSIRAQIVNLMADLKARLGLTYLLIAHDLGMVRHLSDRVAVMYLGKIVELSGCDELFEDPRHPYTRALLSAIPVPDPEAAPSRMLLGGDLSGTAVSPGGCRFRARCPIATPRCAREEPALRPVAGQSGVHWVACHHPGAEPSGASLG